MEIISVEISNATQIWLFLVEEFMDIYDICLYVFVNVKCLKEECNSLKN